MTMTRNQAIDAAVHKVVQPREDEASSYLVALKLKKEIFAEFRRLMGVG